MVDLKKISGLDLKLNGKTGQLIFGQEILKKRPIVRRASEMIEVLRERKFPKGELYYIWRDIKRKKDSSLFEKYHLRYDITVIKAGKIADEFIKTFGHYHPEGYAEIYEVLSGEAFYLIQKVDFHNLKRQMVEDVFIVKAKRGDKVIIPPSYGHISYNCGKKVLVEANLLRDDFKNIYEPIKEAKGGVYFALASDQFLPNKNYKNIPPPAVKKPSRLSRLGFKGPLYSSFIKNSEKFSRLLKRVK